MSTANHVPYTYLLKFIPENKFYYGVRYQKGCHPDDLFTTYFTSSKVIKKLLEEYGKDAFVWEIRKTFNNVDSARQWETDVLKKIHAAQRDDFLNETNNISIPNKKFQTEETKQKIGAKHKGKQLSERTKSLLREKAKKRYADKCLHPRYGKTHTNEAKSKISKVHKGKSISDNQKQILSVKSKLLQSHKYLDKWKYRCTWKITSPSGEITYTKNLTEFCNTHGLTKPLMVVVSKGKQKHHKGYLCEKYHESSDFSNLSA